MTIVMLIIVIIITILMIIVYTGCEKVTRRSEE